MKAQEIYQEVVDSDQQLWQDVKAGNRAAFSHLYKKYSLELFRYGYHLTNNKSLIEDAIHDVFVAIWTSRERLGAIQSLKAYLLSSVRNGIMKKLSTEKRHTLNSTEWAEEIVSENRLSQEMFEREEMLIKNVRNAVNQLTNRQREIIYLHFYQRLSYSEISSLLNIDLRNAYNIASKAYSFLRNRMRLRS